MPELAPPVLAAGSLTARMQPELVADELVLRPWRIDDAPAVETAYGDPLIRQWHVRSLDQAEAVALVASWRTAGRTRLAPSGRSRRATG